MVILSLLFYFFSVVLSQFVASWNISKLLGLIGGFYLFQIEFSFDQVLKFEYQTRISKYDSILGILFWNIRWAYQIYLRIFGQTTCDWCIENQKFATSNSLLNFIFWIAWVINRNELTVTEVGWKAKSNVEICRLLTTEVGFTCFLLKISIFSFCVILWLSYKEIQFKYFYSISKDM